MLKPSTAYLFTRLSGAIATQIAGDATLAGVACVNTQLRLKASTTYVDTQLGLKAASYVSTYVASTQANAGTTLAVGSDSWLKVFGQNPEHLSAHN